MTTYRVVGRDPETMQEFKKLARKAGIHLGAPEEQAEAAWLDAIVNYGLEYNRPWLIRKADGSVRITDLDLASADLCGHLLEQARKKEKEKK